MASETSASAAALSDTPAENDYDTLYATLAESPRGRAFLDEHARRARAADTERLLAAIERLETRIATPPSAPPPSPPVEPPVADDAPVATKAAEATDASAVDKAEPVVTRDIEPDAALIVTPDVAFDAEPVVPHDTTPVAAPEPARQPLTIPQITLFEAQPSRPSQAPAASTPDLEPLAVAQAAPHSPTHAPTAARATAAASSAPPLPALAAVMMLSEDERIALFT